ncbi:MAG: helix-turn-helix domain-containing protein [Actinobacteria bacterium]|nr:helix-turn-helix domain-containing protein [Actinomycetota bacterium]
MTTIADRVREARLAAGLSQTGLAGDAFSPSYISLIEAGHREPTDAALAVLAERLGTTLEFLKHGEEGPNESRTRLELDYARLALVNGEAAEAARRVADLDLSVVTPRLRSEALFTRARALEMLGQLEESIEILEPLYAEALRTGDLLELARVAVDLVVTYLEAGDLHRSVEVGERSMTLLEEASLVGTDEHLRLGSTLLWSYVERGDLLYAAQRVSELIRVAEQLGSPRGRGSVYWNAAVVAEERRDYEQAQRFTERALALLGEGEADRDIPRLRVNYAWLLLRSEPPEPEAALAQLEKAESWLAVLGSAGDRARVDVERSRAYLMLGDLDLATDHARAAFELLGDMPRLETTTALVALGDALEAQGDQAGAAGAYERAASMLAMMSASRQSASIWRDLGDRYLFRGEVKRAAETFDRALREAGLRPSIPLKAMSEVKRSRAALREVKTPFDEVKAPFDEVKTPFAEASASGEKALLAEQEGPAS